MTSPFPNQAFAAQLGAAAMARITLLLNHVLASEVAATDRLKPHAGRSIQLRWTGWPPMFPPAPVVVFAVTPAGLLDWLGEQVPSQADLTLSVDASNPLKLAAMWLGGERPQVGIEGDSALAADVSWLIDNLRWDIEDDVARIVGQGPAHEMARVAKGVSAGLREALRTLQGMMNRPGGDGPR